MKRTAAIIAIVIAALFVAAPATAAVPTLNSNDRLFLKTIRATEPMLKRVSSKTLIDTAKGACKAMRSGLTILDVVALGEESGLDSEVAVALTAGAVVFYCPEQENNY